MSFGKTPKATSTPVFKETWLPGQKEYTSEFIEPWKKILAGDMSSPMAQMLQTITGEAAMRETGRQRQAISGTRGMTSPAKAKAMGKLGETGIAAMAKVPQDIWGEAKDILSQYAMTSPTVASGTSSVSGGWTAGCCFIFIQGEGQLTQIVRQYRDDHYRSGNDPISAGYKWMARWLVPLMQRISLLQEIVRVTMTQPLTEYARWFYGKRSFTLAGWVSKLVWPTLWRVIGRIKHGR